MKLQLAIDTDSLEKAMEWLSQVAQYADIIEIGTPLILAEGIHVLKAIRENYPDKTILFDSKIMDAGEYEASLAFRNGADIVTVLAAAEDNTIIGVVKAAKSYGKQTMADMIAVCDIPKRAQRLDELGIDYLCIHTAVDVYTDGIEKGQHIVMEQLQSLIRSEKIAVAGGMEPQTAIPSIMPYQPGVVVVGSYITGATDLKEAAEKTLAAMR